MNKRLVMLAYARTWEGSDDYALVKAFRRQGHSVYCVDDEKCVLPRWRKTISRMFRKVLRPLLVQELNDAFLSSFYSIQPDVVFVFKGTFLLRSTINTIQKSGVPVVMYYPDLSFFAFGRHLSTAVSAYDYIFSSKSFAREDIRQRFPQFGDKVEFLPLWHDPDIHFPIQLDPQEQKKYACDVSFIGHWSRKKENYLRNLCGRLREGHTVKIWGEGWRSVGDSHFDQAIQKNGIYGLEYTKALRASAITLCILQEQLPGSSLGDQITARTFQIPATETFFLHERTNELSHFFEPESEVATFEGIEDLADRVQYYLENPDIRARIARGGRTRAMLGRYSSDDRAQTILKKSCELIAC